ncbi:MAG: hypothetical protein R3C45_22820 [Phycisphaerales bacterium]
MKLAMLLASALTCFASALHAEVSVKPVGLIIGSPAIEDMDFGFRPNGVNAGTSVHLLISGLDNPIVKLDDDNSTLDSATDSTGKDLLQEPPAKEDGGFMSFSSGPIGAFPRVSDDGKQMIVEFTTPQPPAPGATGITYEGTLHIMVAAGMKTVKAEGVAAAPGNVQLGDANMQIAEYGPSDWEEGKFKLTIKLDTQLLDAISSWKVTAPDGTELSDGPNSTMTMMNNAEVELTLEKKTDTINIELELFDGLDTIQVPVKAQVGLGIE